MIQFQVKQEEGWVVVDKVDIADTVDTKCKDRISVLEHSAKLLSNIHDEHKSLKVRLETVAKNIETTKTVNKD
jgi:hypothetical protein